MRTGVYWVFVQIVVLGWSGCSRESHQTDTTNVNVYDPGKADEMAVCPAAVGINSGAGSQRRCYDLQNGRFVATECCQQLCSGAEWRMQGNGTRCAWIGEPGLPGAWQAQFAPRMCCELNDRQACARSALSGSECIDPQDPQKVLPGTCCGQDEEGCHPEILWDLRSCSWNVIEAVEGDPLDGSMTIVDAVEKCFTQGNYPQVCLDELRSEYDCVFGLTYHDIFKASARIVVATKRILTEVDISTLLPVQQDQLLTAVQQAAYEDVHTVEDAISVVDQKMVYYHELWEGSNGRAYQSYEFGAGDNSYGAIFELGTLKIAARIHDGDLYDGSESSLPGCRIPYGPRWTDCQLDSDCSTGLSCVGKIEHPTKGAVGRCVDVDLGAEASQGACSAADPCALQHGLICSGLTASDTGVCRPAWMSRRFQSPSVLKIPDNDAGGLVSNSYAYGLATLNEEVVVDLEIEHPDPSQLLITLNNPTGPDGSSDSSPDSSIEVVFDGSNPQHLAELGDHDGWAQITRSGLFPDKGSVNGVWTLTVVDGDQHHLGKLHGWELLLRSSWE